MYSSVKLSFVLFLDSFTSPDEYENLNYVFKLVEKTANKQSIHSPNINFTNYANSPNINIIAHSISNNNNNNATEVEINNERDNNSEANNINTQNRLNIPEMLRTISEKKAGAR